MAVSSSPRRNTVVATCLSLLLVGFLYAGNSFNMAIKNATRSHFGQKTSRLHLLIPADRANLRFCYHLASAGANRHPVPTLIGWNGQGDFNLAKHSAKLRVLKRYLDSLDVAEADDLVLFADGYDVIYQLPPEIFIERYFEEVKKANAYLAQRLGLSVENMAEKGVQQAVFFGPDKMCFPNDANAARCWAVPDSPLGKDAFGPRRENDEMSHQDPRWLNSGTIIGSVSELKKIIDASNHEYKVTFDEEYQFKFSDQYYLANVFGRQEYWRNQIFRHENGTPAVEKDHVIPEKESDTQVTELHMAIDYESSLFLPRAGNDRFTGFLQYNREDQSASMDTDVLQKGESFRSHLIRMPDNVRNALIKLYDSVSSAHPGAVSGKDWIQLVHLGTNFVTNHIYGLLHFTGPKESMDYEYAKQWFFPFVKSLLRETVKAWKRGDPISKKLIDGRRWIPKLSYHEQGTVHHEYGGAWTDESPPKFLTWKEMCGNYEDVLFWGQQATGM
ncbi:hypothetical protein E4U53_005930 [Claviceps sorghi]|nr:hypothetical protein E4U53_005930 [Claviceps sorghi]